MNMTTVCFANLSVSANPDLWDKIDTFIKMCAGITFNDTCDDTQLNNHASKNELITSQSPKKKLPDKIINYLQSSQINTASMTDSELTAWLMPLFANLFKEHNVILIHASSLNKDEPEYLPADTISEIPAMICFAHGFFASALHEISHWSIAGTHRRTLADFGYWYAPDGRNETQQHSFEQVEIKPQAIECLLTLACRREFRVSQDNLFADFDTSHSTFEADVYQQVIGYLSTPDTLPKDALLLISVFYKLCR